MEIKLNPTEKMKIQKKEYKHNKWGRKQSLQISEITFEEYPNTTAEGAL